MPIVVNTSFDRKRTARDHTPTVNTEHLVALSKPTHSLAINLLGLTWHLQPSEGPVLNNGLSTAGLPVNSDVATLPSGGRAPWPGSNSSIDSGDVEVGRRVSQEIPPGVFWRSLLHLVQPQFLKFNISLGKDALFGVYIRKGLPPSHAQVSNVVSQTSGETSIRVWGIVLCHASLRLDREGAALSPKPSPGS
ncbi:hypothetical protein J4Q44_G00311460 [Coregonus suidteri]|uniref:Teneurin-1-4-like galactose-binding domain-containing protein n=1 Tax=Coregonus suidteri TaxID=861788 RepID=A0AAN8L3F1_9TELE